MKKLAYWVKRGIAQTSKINLEIRPPPYGGFTPFCAAPRLALVARMPLYLILSATADRQEFATGKFNTKIRQDVGFWYGISAPL
jgi:hypothetical protein